MKFCYLAIAAIAAVEAVKTKGTVPSPLSLRKLKKGKSSKNAPECPNVGSKSSKKGSCDKPFDVACGNMLSGEVTLSSSLECADGMGLMVEGADSVLDCGGNMVFKPDGAKEGVGITLKDGAMAINCYVKGFEKGFLLSGDGGNTLMGSVAFDNKIGIKVEAKGCNTIDNVQCFSNQQEGLLVTVDDDETGTLTVKNSDFIGNAREGIDITDSSAGILLVTEDVVLLSNKGGVKFKDNEDITWEVYGSVVITDTEETAIKVLNNVDSISIIVYGNLDVKNSGEDGFDLDSDTALSVTLEEGSTTSFCDNEVIDIDIGNGNDFDLADIEKIGPLLCNTFEFGNIDDSTFICTDECPNAPGTVSGCGPDESVV